MENNNQFEQYKRIIKFISASVIVIAEVLIYGFVWMNFYNRNMQLAFWRRGNWLVLGEYTLLLMFFHRMYGGLRVGIYRYATLVYSHMVSIVAVNIFAYVQVVLFDKKMHNPTALLTMTVMELVLVMIWAWGFKQLYAHLFPKRRLLLVYGEKPMFHLKDRIGIRDDKYEIASEVPIKMDIDSIMELAENYGGMIVGDIPAHERNQLIKLCYGRNIRTYAVPKISDILLRSSIELNIFDSPLYLSRNVDELAWEQEICKRMSDLLLAGILLILTSPFFIMISLLIKITDNGNVFYVQDRLTKNGKVFKIIKFRTMVADAEKKTGPIKAEEKDPRILPLGRFLRATRMDELPQLINILKGEMSLVGPRPERPELAKIITKNIPEFEYRLKVKAGLTGYAQIYGRYCTTSYDKLKLDLTYIRNYSIWMDLKLLIMTPKVLLIKESTDGFEDGKWMDPALKE